MSSTAWAMRVALVCAPTASGRIAGHFVERVRLTVRLDEIDEFRKRRALRIIAVFDGKITAEVREGHEAVDLRLAECSVAVLDVLVEHIEVLTAPISSCS